MENFHQLCTDHLDKGIEEALRKRRHRFHEIICRFSNFLEEPLASISNAPPSSSVAVTPPDAGTEVGQPSAASSLPATSSEVVASSEKPGDRVNPSKRSTSPPRPSGYKFLKRPGQQPLPTERPTNPSETPVDIGAFASPRGPRASGHGEGRLADFELRWQCRQPFGDAHWTAFRGPFGESVLQVLFAMYVRDFDCFPGRASEYRSLLLDLLPAAPELAGVERNEEPFLGQSLMHEACAHGDVEMVALLLQPGLREHVDLEIRDRGLFLQAVLKSNMPGNDMVDHPTNKGTFYGQTPIETAIFAPRDDDVAIRLVTMLAQAGGRLVFRVDEHKRRQSHPSLFRTQTLGGIRPDQGEVHYTVLHSLARARWSGPGPYLLSESRVMTMVDLLLDPKSELSGHTGPGVRDSSGVTPLQIAARQGNLVAFTHMLDRMKVVVWEWGNTMQYAFPLAPLDSGPKGASSLSAVEQATLCRQHSVISIGIMGAIIEEKWDRFGKNHLLFEFFVDLVIMFCLGIVCTRGFENAGTLPPALLSVCRWIGLVISVLYLLTYIILGAMACTDPFFKHLSWVPWGLKGTSANPSLFGTFLHKLFGCTPDHLELSSIFPVRNCSVVFLMLFCLLSAPWPHPLWLCHSTFGTETDRVIWEVGASIAWLIIAAHTSTFFLLFQFTAPLAATLPGVFWHDFRPFCVINLVLFLCICIALRVAMASSAHEDDAVFGTWWGTMLTMEEAIHGPDVQWRNAVYGHHPAIAGFIFIGALWVWVIMMTVLVSLFSDRYEKLKSQVREQILYQRAAFVLSGEKLMPLCLFRAFNLRMGRRLGGVVFEDYHRQINKRMAWQTSDETTKLLLGDHHLDEARLGNESARQFGDANDEESQQLVPESRWLAWQGAPSVINRWKEHYVPETYEYFL